VTIARIATVALLLVLSGAADAGTITRATPATPESIAFWDRDHGLAAFVRYGPMNQSHGHISVTADGGKTWTIRWRGTAVSAVATVTETGVGLAQVWSRTPCGNCQAKWIRTEDGGRTWRVVGTAPWVLRPSFPSRRVGFAMSSKQADAGDLMKTVDAGRTWRRIGSPCSKGWGGYAWGAALSFVSPTRGWLLCTGQPDAGSQSKALYVTSDGGRRWRRILNAHFERGRIRLGGLQSSGYAHEISFDRSGHGLLWGSRGYSLWTADGGRHWHPVSATSPEIREGWSGSVVSDRIAFLLVHDTGARRYQKLVRTADAGRTWKLVRDWG
jgi:photosystem II stability/assembly factor-like uncharacterized protein